MAQPEGKRMNSSARPGAANSSTDQRIGVLQFELDYRRNKQNNIFSWCSAILVAIISGTLILSGAHPIPLPRKLFISVAVAGLSFFAFIWLGYNARRESLTAAKLEELTGCELRDKNNGEATASKVVGYRVAVALLAIAALFAIWRWT